MHVEIKVKLSTGGSSFEDNEGELRKVLGQIPNKVLNQLDREPGCICVAPEADDVLIDTYGNTCGSIEVEKT